MTEVKKGLEDWSSLTNEEVYKRVKLLWDNRKKYDISISDDDTICFYETVGNAYRLVDKLTIVFGDVREKASRVDTVKINGKLIRADAENGGLLYTILDLYDYCKNAKKSFGDKVKETWTNAKEPLVYGVVFMGVIGALMFGMKKIQTNTEAKAKQNAKEMLQKYEQERAKGNTVNIDSLLNQHMR